MLLRENISSKRTRSLCGCYGGRGGGVNGNGIRSTNTDAQRYTFMYILPHMVRGEKDSQVLKDEIFLAGFECVDQLKDVWVV